MNYRNLGASGLKVSEISLGSWTTYGGSVGVDDATRIVRQAFDAGVNLFDTADVYVKGEAAYARAIDFIETRAAEYPVHEIVSHTFPLERAEDAIRAAAGQNLPPGFVKAAIVP